MNVTQEEMTDEDLIDMIDEAISDSFDMDWSGRDGARAVLRMLEHEGLEIAPKGSAAEVSRLKALISETADECGKIASGMGA